MRISPHRDAKRPQTVNRNHVLVGKLGPLASSPPGSPGSYPSGASGTRPQLPRGSCLEPDQLRVGTSARSRARPGTGARPFLGTTLGTTNGPYWRRTTALHGAPSSGARASVSSSRPGESVDSEGVTLSVCGAGGASLIMPGSRVRVPPLLCSQRCANPVPDSSFGSSPAPAMRFASLHRQGQGLAVPVESPLLSSPSSPPAELGALSSA